jgi:hypothetical protein
MRWLMRKLARGLQGRFCSFSELNDLSAFFSVLQLNEY